MNPLYTGRPDTITPQQRDNETLRQAIERQAHEKAKREPLLADQGKLEGGLDETKIA
jgi:hypothetical protein